MSLGRQGPRGARRGRPPLPADRNVLTRNPGFTLIELIVALVILGIAYGVALVAIRNDHQMKPADPQSRIETLRHSAIRNATAVSANVGDGGDRSWRDVTANPDGSIVADSLLGVDRLSGRPPIFHDSARAHGGARR
jgi:prepilin-type N-terminal cleavage/methylation domain-containing protein